MRRRLAAALAFTVLAAAGPAAAQMSITVVGNSLARSCAEAAIAGDSSAPSEHLCTLALTNEPLNQINRASTYVNRGVIRLRRAAWTAAAADFDRALAVKADLGEAYVNRGAAAIGQTRYTDGLRDIEQALSLGVSEPEKAYYNRAIAHEGMNNLTAAYLAYRKAAELNPAWPEPQKQLARFTVTSR